MGRAGHLAPVAVASPPTTMQREPVRLAIEAVAAMARVRGLRSIAGDERGQSGIALLRCGGRLAPIVLVARRIRLMMLLVGAAAVVLLAGIGLRVPRRIWLLRLAPEGRIAPLILFTLFEAVLARLAAFRTEIRLALPELLLGGRNQSKVMLSMLVVVFCRNRIARALRIAR